ncbi:MAG TPA: hypothetical protein DIT49_02685 [Clostridiales bacterium]|nr:hypothetical protein [Clostridiales bacterium]
MMPTTKTHVSAQPNENEELVEFFAPYADASQRQDLLVAVNGQTLRIRRGVPVRIPKKFYKVIRAAMEQERVARNAMEQAQRRGEEPAARF